MAGLTFARFLASGLGVGFFPVAPGTAGSLVAVLVGAPLVGSPLLLGFAAVMAMLAGFWAIPRAEGHEDPGWVVIDEFAGQWIAMLGLAAATPVGLALAFALFRLLDVTKPGPVGWADRQHGVIGVMLDDVLAGIGAGVLAAAARLALPGYF